MLTVASLLAAMTIAGAFWVGVLAARRLRDWGEGRRALEDGGQGPLAIAAAAGAPPDDPRSRRIRELVARKLQGDRLGGRMPIPRNREPIDHPTARPPEDVSLTSLRAGDVVLAETGQSRFDGDYLVEGLVHLREGATTSVVAMLADGDRHRWLVGSADAEQWMLVEPVVGHGLSGEPPRNIRRATTVYALARRGQASAACTGRHGRPELPRAATYVYTASSRDVLWVERWGNDVLMGDGVYLEPHEVSFLPGS